MERGRYQTRSDEKAFALGQERDRHTCGCGGAERGRNTLSAREIAIEVMLRRGQPGAPNHEIVQESIGTSSLRLSD
jgi:hypothetical protein